MKAKNLEMQCQKKEEGLRRKILPTTALFWVLLWASSECNAQNTSNVNDGATVTEVTQQWTEIEWERIIDLEMDKNVSNNGWSDDEKYDSIVEPNLGDEKWLADEIIEKEKSRIETHGFIQVWTSIVPDFASIFSDKNSMLMCVSVTDQSSWIWMSLIRLDDFDSDPAYPISKASVIVPYWNKAFGDGKWSFWANVECTFIDKLPGTIDIMPVVVWSYNANSGWTFEWKYFHGFQEWSDMNAFRLWVTKKIGDALNVTAQWWYKSDYDKRVFGRVIVDVNLWNWLWAQLSCIAKDWKLTPTAWVIYSF